MRIKTIQISPIITLLYLLVLIIPMYTQEHFKEFLKGAQTTDSLVVKGKAFLEFERYDSARLVLQKAVELAQNTQNKQQEALAYAWLTEAFWYRGNLKEAGQCVQKSIQIYSELELLPEVAQLFFLAGELSWDEGDRTQAKTSFEKSILLAEKINNKELEFHARIAASRVISSLKYDSTHLHRALKIAEELDHEALLTEVYKMLATSNKSTGNLGKAEHYFIKLIQLGRCKTDSLALITDLRSLAGIYGYTGSYEAAQQCYIEALKIAEHIGDILLMTELYTEIGSLFLKGRQWEKSKENIEKAFDLLQLSGLDQQLIKAKNLSNYGQVFEQLGMPEKAFPYYQQAKNLYEKLGDDTHYAESYWLMGRLLDQKTDYNQALKSYHRALELKLAEQDRVGVIAISLAIAKIYMEQNNLNSAQHLLENCVQIGLTTKSREQLQEVYYQLAEVHYRKKNYKEGLDFSRRSAMLKDSILTAKIARTTVDLQSIYELEKQTRINAEQNLWNTEISLKNQRLRVWVLSISLAAILLVSVLILFNLKKRQEHRQRIIILQKEKEAQSLRSIITGEENERKRIARDLHDGLGTLLAAARIQVNGLLNLKPELNKEKPYIQTASLLDDACREVRRISHNMMPMVLEQHGLEQGILEICNNFSRDGLMEIDFIPFGLDEPLDSGVSNSVFRIIQELLKNVAQHAKATEVIVQVTVEDGSMNLVVEDNGRGFDLNTIQSHAGIGLENVRSRVVYLGGSLDIKSLEGEGSTFTIDIPLHSTFKN